MADPGESLNGATSGAPTGVRPPATAAGIRWTAPANNDGSTDVYETYEILKADGLSYTPPRFAWDPKPVHTNAGPRQAPQGSPNATTPAERAAKQAHDDEQDRIHEKALSDARSEAARIKAESDALDREERKNRDALNAAIKREELAADAAEKAAARAALKAAQAIVQAWAEKKDRLDREAATADRTLKAEIEYAQSRRADKETERLARETKLKEDEFLLKLSTTPSNFYNYITRMWGGTPMEPPAAKGAPDGTAPGTPVKPEADLAPFLAAYKKAFGKDATDKEWNSVADLTGLSNELIRLLPDRILKQFPTSRLKDLSNDDLLPLLKAHPEMLGALSGERLATFGPGVIDAIRGTAAATAPGAPVAPTMDPTLAKQLAEWQAARSAKGEDPNDMAAFRAHVIAMGSPDPGVVAAPAAAAKPAVQAFIPSGAPAAAPPPAASGAPGASAGAATPAAGPKIWERRGDLIVNTQTGVAYGLNNAPPEAYVALGTNGTPAGPPSPPPVAAATPAAGHTPAENPTPDWHNLSLGDLEKYPDSYLITLPQSVLEAFRNEFLLSRPALMAHLSPDRIRGTGAWAGKGTGFSADVIAKHGLGAPAPPMPKTITPAVAATGMAGDVVGKAVPIGPAVGAPSVTPQAAGGFIPASAGAPMGGVAQQNPPAQGAPGPGMTEEQIVALANDFLRKQAQQGAPA